MSSGRWVTVQAKKHVPQLLMCCITASALRFLIIVVFPPCWSVGRGAPLAWSLPCPLWRRRLFARLGVSRGLWYFVPSSRGGRARWCVRAARARFRPCLHLRRGVLRRCAAYAARGIIGNMPTPRLCRFLLGSPFTPPVWR